MIYIDPPYNTGNDSFIYPDKFSETRDEYLSRIGDKDEGGYLTREGLFRKNSRDSGHYHSNWLSMMYPRLFLARNLLREDGVIFVSIDDNEIHNLRLLMNEVFGEENFIAQITWKKTYGGGSKAKHFVGLHEYILCFAKLLPVISKIDIPPDPESRKYYKGKDDKFEERGPFRTQPLATTSMDERPNLRFPIVWEENEIWPEKQWQWSKERVEEALKSDELILSKTSGKWSVRYKQYLLDTEGKERSAKLFTIQDGPYTQIGTYEINELFGNGKVFPFPKPSSLIKHLLKLTWEEKDAIILDFFSGSSPTAQAVLELSNEDISKSKFICVQIPENTEENSVAYKMGYKTIAEVGKERIRRVIEKMKISDNERPESSNDRKIDLGFKVFKLLQSNFKIWQPKIESEEQLQEQLKLHVDMVMPSASTENILYELLLKSGVPLNAKIEEREGCFFVVEHGMALILEEMNDDLVKAVINGKPKKVICLDRLFSKNDQLKTNTALQMKDAGIDFRVV